MHYQKPHLLQYRTIQALSNVLAACVFRRKLLRNEIRDRQGPFVVIANHQCALDFVNLIGTTARPMTFVISNSFYQTLPFKGFLHKLGFIPKQQFQTSVRDMKRMKAVIEHGQPLVLYPAGLMCEDGLSTPIPAATYKFLKWLGVDVYMARISGSYFVMPKWTKGFRPGRTYLDIYRLFTKEELAQMDEAAIRQRADEALLFDAYREQETNKVPYLHNNQLAGLENVLYVCPQCKTEFSMEVSGGTTLRCSHCGYTEAADRYGLMTKTQGKGPELRYVSDWSRMIHGDLKERIRRGLENGLTAGTRIAMIDPEKHAFVEVGRGTLRLNRDSLQLCGTIRDQVLDLTVSAGTLPTLPFSPGRYLEVQDGDQIYRCILEDGRLVMKCIHMIKIFHELSRANETAVSPA